jgi:hypothetical protein
MGRKRRLTIGAPILKDRLYNGDGWAMDWFPRNRPRL